jgi:hypothetical protein
MPYTQAIIPLRGWIADTAYSGVPEGYTHDILNMIPADPFRRKIRLGTRPGFNRMFRFDTNSVVQCLVRTTAFSGSSDPVVKDRVLAVNAGKIYYIDPGGDPQQVLGPSSVTTAALNTTGRVEGVQRGQYCYFVDGTHYRKVNLFANPPVWSNWEHASHGPEDVVKKVISGTTYTATLIALFGSRLVLAGVRQLENVWFMSSIEDPEKWSTSTGTADDAIAGNDGQWGAPGDNIVALIPFGQGSIIFAGSKSMSMLTQDPVFGSASIQQMSRTVGIVGPRAWCNGPEKTVYVLAQDGLYRLNPNDFNIDRGQLVSLSRLDSFFDQVKWEDIDASLVYDVERRGLWIYLTRTDQPTSSTHLFYSDQVDGFFPFKMYDPTFVGAYSNCQMLTTDGRNQVALMGSSDGMLGYFDQKVVAGIDGYVAAGYPVERNPTIGQSIAQQIPSRVSIGPMVSTQPGLAFCSEVQIELGADVYLPDTNVKGSATNPVAQLLSADTAQEAIAEDINSLLISALVSITANGGNANLSTPGGAAGSDPQVSPDYNGGGASQTVTEYLDGQFSAPIEGTYTTQDTFLDPLRRVYEDNDSAYELVRGSIGGATRWYIRFQSGDYEDFPLFVQQQVNGQYAEDPSVGEYRYTVTNSSGGIVSTLSTVTDSISINLFEGATVTSLGNLAEGANNRMRCRVRANAMFLRLSSSGYPFAIERIAANLEPVGPRRTVIDV